MARKKTANPKNAAVETEEIILDGNMSVPQLKVDRPVESAAEKHKVEDKTMTAIDVSKDDPMIVVPDDIKALRPDDVYGPDEETSAEMGDRLQDSADRYKAELNEISEIDELKKMEQEWIDKLDKMDEYLKNATTFAINNTNVRKMYRTQFLQKILPYNPRIVYVYCEAPSLDESKKRRERMMPTKVIDRMWNDLDFPDKTEYSEIIYNVQRVQEDN